MILSIKDIASTFHSHFPQVANSSMGNPDPEQSDS